MPNISVFTSFFFFFCALALSSLLAVGRRGAAVRTICPCRRLAVTLFVRQHLLLLWSVFTSAPDDSRTLAAQG
jgi:hypothetical protein